MLNLNWINCAKVVPFYVQTRKRNEISSFCASPKEITASFIVVVFLPGTRFLVPITSLANSLSSADYCLSVPSNSVRLILTLNFHLLHFPVLFTVRYNLFMVVLALICHFFLRSYSCYIFLLVAYIIMIIIIIISSVVSLLVGAIYLNLCYYMCSRRGGGKKIKFEQEKKCACVCANRRPNIVKCRSIVLGNFTRSTLFSTENYSFI